MVAIPPLKVDFNLDGKATSTGGEALTQSVKYGEAAEAPELAVATGWLFYEWDDTFSEVLADTSVTALFYDSVDTDGDGLWDGWELKHFGDLVSSDGSPTSNQDNDTRSEMDEFLAGTYPLSNDSFLKILDFELSESGLSLRLSTTT